MFSYEVINAKYLEKRGFTDENATFNDSLVIKGVRENFYTSEIVILD